MQQGKITTEKPRCADLAARLLVLLVDFFCELRVRLSSLFHHSVCYCKSTSCRFCETDVAVGGSLILDNCRKCLRSKKVAWGDSLFHFK